MENIKELVMRRKSVRSFDGAPLRPEDREKLKAYLAAGIGTPFGFPMEFRLLEAKEHGLSSPVVSGTGLYAAGKLRREALAEEAFGFAFEKFILYAAGLGVGTVWIAGTMDRPAFERAMDLGAGEFMPAVTPLGYPAAKRTLRDAAMRRAMHSDSRRDFEKLFFENSFETPLAPENAGLWREPLELVRWAPSACNKQPWRIVKQGETFHFYKKSSLPRSPEVDVQRLDIGIALAHFVLALGEQGVSGSLAQTDPGLAHAEDETYILSWSRG